MDPKDPVQRGIIKDLLTGAVFDEFYFSTGFFLFFVCSAGKRINGVKLPVRISLSIAGEWWFGNKEKWTETVKRLTEGSSFVEPDEPVLAYKLAALRWNGNSTVTCVQLDEDRLVLGFDNETITISNHCDNDSAWEIREITNSHACDSDRWYFICDDEIYYNIPEING